MGKVLFMIRNEDNKFILETPFFRRELETGTFGLRTNSFRNLVSGTEYLYRPCREFAFSIDRHYVNSVQTAEYQAVDGTVLRGDDKLEFTGSSQIHIGDDAEELMLTFRVLETEITAHYRIYSKIAGMRKWLTFTALNREILLENLIFDDTLLTPGGIPSECDFYQGNQFSPAPVSFTMEGTEDLVCCRNEQLQESVLTATTAAGPLRYTMCYPEWGNLMNACSMSAASFAKYLKAGETFESPAVLTALAQGEISSGKFAEEMRKLIRAGLPAFPATEQVMFCTWPGYNLDVSEKLMFDLADRAAELGIGCIVLDIGWFPWCEGKGTRGRATDPARFPNGMEAVSDYLHKKGIRFGLWVNIGNDEGDPIPDDKYNALMSDGTPKRLGWNYVKAFHTKCFASGYREEILQQIDKIAGKYQVDYFKFDASSILSPYGVLAYGCHAKDHEHHKCFADSIPEMFAGYRYLREELQKKHPGLLIDFSFESFGCERPSIAALEYSELTHLTNQAAINPEHHNIWKIRRNFYRHTGPLPPERLMHGLVSVREENAAEVLLTSCVGAPLISGDILQLTDPVLQRIKKMIKAFSHAVKNGPLLSFEVLCDTKEVDSFRRYAPHGGEILCVFNRSDKSYEIQRSDLLDADTGVYGNTVPPQECKLFWKD